MTIVQLETFLKVSETKNFTLAASSLGYRDDADQAA